MRSPLDRLARRRTDGPAVTIPATLLAPGDILDERWPGERVVKLTYGRNGIVTMRTNKGIRRLGSNRRVRVRGAF